MRNWPIDEANALDVIASHYTSVFGAFYEYIKNIEEQQATKIYIDFDFHKKQITIAGDGTSVDNHELDRIIQSGLKSRKDAKHFGAGLFSFSSFSTKMTLISRHNDTYYIIDCDRRLNYGSDSDAAREMQIHEMTRYGVAVGHLRHLKQGTAFVIEEVGTCLNKPSVFCFKMSEEFEGTKFVKWMQEANGYNLHRISYMLKINDGKPKRIPAKLGKGKSVKFTVPSKEFPYPKNVFILNEHQYKLTVDFDLWLGRAHESGIKIGEEYQNFLPFNDAVNNSRKIDRNSIFRFNPLTKYVAGIINFTIKPMSNGPAPIVYTGARDRLLLENTFGDCLANLLMYVDVNIMQQIVCDYDEDNSEKKQIVRSQKLNETISEFFSTNRDSFEWLELNLNSVNKRTITCVSCKLETEPLKVSSGCNFTIKSTRILEYDDYYECPNCGKKWDKRTYTQKSEPRNPPIYHPPQVPDDPNTTKPRERVRGHGYVASVCNFGPSDPRAYRFVPPTSVEVNSEHPNYKKHATKTQKIRTAVNYLLYYETQCATLCVLNHALKDKPVDEALKMQSEAIRMLYSWFF
jgi:hypothetical protein